MNPVAVATKPAITTSILLVPIRKPTRFRYVIATESTIQAVMMERISPELNCDDTAKRPNKKRSLISIFHFVSPVKPVVEQLDVSCVEEMAKTRARMEFSTVAIGSVG